MCDPPPPPPPPLLKIPHFPSIPPVLPDSNIVVWGVGESGGDSCGSPHSGPTVSHSAGRLPPHPISPPFRSQTGQVIQGLRWHNQNTFGPTEGRDVQWREANRRRQRQANQHHGLVPNPPSLAPWPPQEYVNADDPSLLRFLLESREEVTETQLRDDLLSMLVAGHETTGSVLTWTLYLLSQNPDKLALAQEELDRVLGDRVPTYEDFANLRYLTRCVNESMRLYPHPPVLIRRCGAVPALAVSHRRSAWTGLRPETMCSMFPIISPSLPSFAPPPPCRDILSPCPPIPPISPQHCWCSPH